MEFDSFFIILILLGVLSAIGGVLWWVFVIWVAAKAVSQAQRNLDTLLPNLQRTIQAYSQLPANQRAGQQAQILSMMANANTQLSQLNDLRRQKYEADIVGLRSMVISSGFDPGPMPY